MLTSAQDKYFVEHGAYSQSLTGLNAPIKEIREQNPGNPYTNIITTNFTYDKVYTQHCILGISNRDGNYTLVKNYKTREKVGCTGQDCNLVSDFVDGIEDYNTLCPNEVNCELNDDWCKKNGGGNSFFWESDCDCHKCSFAAYENCQNMGGFFNENTCECNKISNDCGEEGQILSMEPTGEDCPYTGPDPVYGSGNNGGNGNNASNGNQNPDRGIDPGGNNYNTYSCGMLYRIRVCENKHIVTRTECRSKVEYCHELGMNLDPETCECVKNCPLPKPSVTAVCGANTHNVELCDPCVGTNSVLPGNDRGLPGAELTCCGYRNTDGQGVECNHATGEWECINNNPCNQVNGDVGEVCDGTPSDDPNILPGNQCGIKVMDQCRLNDSFSGAEILTSCQLNSAAGYQCFDGQTTTEGCPEGQEKTCESCYWGECHPSQSLCGPEPEQNDPCGTLGYQCQQDENGDWEWVRVPENDSLFSTSACWNGQTQPCSLNNGNQGSQTCENCQWSVCGDGCNPDDKLPDETAPCYTKDGETDPERFCGTTIRTQVCIDNQWQWQDGECENVQEKPELEPIQCPGKPCHVHESIRACTFSGDRYYWNHSSWTECHLRSGANCGVIGEILGGSYYNPIFCSDSCLSAQCNSGYMYNHRVKKCFKSEKKVAVIRTVIPGSPPQNSNSNSRGEVKSFTICGPINQGTNVEGGKCLRTCQTIDDTASRMTNFDDEEDYCFNTDTFLIAVNVSPIPKKVPVCNMDNHYWDKHEEFEAYKCIEGPYHIVPHP